MVNTTRFTIGFIKFSGWLEILFGIFFLFIDYFLQMLGIPNFWFFSVFSGITMIVLGYLLWYSARDLSDYTIIPISSSIFRYFVAFGPELITIISGSPLNPILIGGMIYDIFSATLTLLLLKKLKYF